MKKNEGIRIVFDVLMKQGYEDNKQDSISEWCTKDGFENPVYVKKFDLNRLEIPGSLGWIDSVAVTALGKDFSDACDSDVRVAINDGKGHRSFLYINELETTTVEMIASRVTGMAVVKPKELNLWSLLLHLEEFGATSQPYKDVKIILSNRDGVIIDKRDLYANDPKVPEGSAVLINGKDSVNIYVTI